LNHINKKCPAISPADRRKALLEQHNVPDEMHNPSNGHIPMNGATTNLPLGTSPWTGLDTLAEVSRMVHPGHPGSSGRHPQEHGTNRLNIAEHYTPSNPPLSFEQRRKGMSFYGLISVVADLYRF
jgi:hypothetical protein